MILVPTVECILLGPVRLRAGKVQRASMVCAQMKARGWLAIADACELSVVVANLPAVTVTSEGIRGPVRGSNACSHGRGNGAALVLHRDRLDRQGLDPRASSDRIHRAAAPVPAR